MHLTSKWAKKKNRNLISLKGTLDVKLGLIIHEILGVFFFFLCCFVANPQKLCLDSTNISWNEWQNGVSVKTKTKRNQEATEAPRFNSSQTEPLMWRHRHPRSHARPSCGVVSLGSILSHRKGQRQVKETESFFDICLSTSSPLLLTVGAEPI